MQNVIQNSPQLNVHFSDSVIQVIWLLCTGARETSFRNIKSIAECLADQRRQGQLQQLRDQEEGRARARRQVQQINKTCYEFNTDMGTIKMCPGKKTGAKRNPRFFQRRLWSSCEYF